MKFSVFWSKFLRRSERGKNSPGISEQDVIFSVLLGVILIGLALFSADAYLFYATVMRRDAPPVASPQVRVPLSGENIDEVIRLIDERARKFQEILNQ